MDITALSTPLSQDSPVGLDLRKDFSPHSLYHQVKDARNLARSLERQQLQENTEVNPTIAWQKVIELSQKIFTTYSKDLEICAWFIEALLRVYGFVGLRDGFIFARQLSEQFWDIIYPLPDEDGIFTRVAAFAGLNGIETDGALILPISNLPLTDGPNKFNLWQFDQAQEVSRMSDPVKQSKRIEDGAVVLKTIELEAAETSEQFYRALIKTLNECLDQYKAFIAFLDLKCGSDSPPSSRIQNTISRCRDATIHLSQFTKKTMEDNFIENDLVKTSGQLLNKVSEIKFDKREEAFKTLLQIANYFETVEPHSPLSYLLQKVIRWGTLSLPQLLQELIKDDKVLDEVFVLTGIAKQESGVKQK